MKENEEEVWFKNPKDLFLSLKFPNNDMSISSYINSITRLIIFIYLLLFIFNINYSYFFLIFCIVFIIIFYNIKVN